MITFISLETTNKVLKIINNCINEMIDNELSLYYDIDKDDENEVMDFLERLFPKYLCREDLKKCMNVLHDLKEWTKDSYLHDLTCVHEYALFHIFEHFFDEKEDFEKFREKGKRHIYNFYVKDIQNYEPYEIEILKKINNRSFYEEELFWDWDFLNLDDIVYLYQTNIKKFKELGINLRYYLDLMPKDVREDIENELNNKQKSDETETFIITHIENVIKQMEMNPKRLEKSNENEISDDIKDRLQFVLATQNINIEREARGGYASKEIGEIDFFLYKNENNRYIQIAMGENKVWGRFEKQIQQLLGYSNKNINFGFTIVINRNDTYEKIKNTQKEILQKFNIKGKFDTINIEEKGGILISTHTIPEESKFFKIYHFILNANGQERKEIANIARDNSIEISQETSINTNIENTNNQEIVNSTIDYISERIDKPVSFDDMIDILEKLELIILDGSEELIDKFKRIGTSKRKKSVISINNKKYSNINVFDINDSPIMGFAEKIKKEKDKILVGSNVSKTLEQYKEFNFTREKVIKREYIVQAIKLAHEKYKILDLLNNKKIDIFITNKGREEYRSYLYKDYFDEEFEIFLYTDEEAIYTTLFQLGTIINIILCDEEEVIPKDFIKINKNKKINVDLLKRTKEERMIIFSDLFAVTVLKDTDLEYFAPFTLNNEANAIIEDYFKEAISKKIKGKEK